VEGTSSVLFAREGTQDRLLQGATAYLDALDADADLLYADLHATKHADKFVLIEMYRDGAARKRQSAAAHGRSWASLCGNLLRPDSVVERIRPLLSAPPAMARPVDDGGCDPRAPLRCAIGIGCQPCGAFVRVFPKPDCEQEFIPILHAQGERVAEHEPGFVYADFYRLDAPGCWLVVEYYDDRSSLSHHHTLPQTLKFADHKAGAGYESRKHEAFTLRPIASAGPWARTFVAAAAS